MPGNLVSSSFSRGEVTPELGGRVDIATYKTSLATCRNMIVRSYGGVYNRGGTQFIGFARGTGADGGPSRLRRFRFNTTDVYILEFSNLAMRVIRNDAYVLDTLKAVTAVTAGGVVTIAAHGYSAFDMVVMDDSFVGAPLLAGRWVSVGSPTTDTFQALDPITGSPITNIGGAYVSGGHAGHVYTLTTPYTYADLPQMSFVQSADVMTITVADQAEQELTRTGDAAWVLTTPTFAPSITPPTALVAVAVTTGSTGYFYVVTAIDAATGEESLISNVSLVSNGADPTVNPWLNSLAWVAPVGFTVALYSIYRAINGIFGFIGDSPTTTFIDNNFQPDLSTNPPLVATDPFAGGNNPGTAMYFQQRLIRAGSTAAPDTLYCSQTGLYFNFNVSQPSVDSDALTLTLTSREVNAVRHMVPIKQDLITFTTGQEWRVTANGAAFAAPNLAILSQSSWGTGYLEPILIGLTILYVRENGLCVRSARYTYLSDAYTGEEVSLLSSHLLSPQAQMTSWAFGITPDPVVIGVLSSGQATCLTYQEEQQINAWTRWDTQGAWEAVEITRPDLSSDSLDDEIYFVANRVVDGATNVRTVEKISPRRFTDVRDCFFVDAGLSFDHPVAITGINFGGGGVTITAPGHGLTTGTTVSISDVNWQPAYDANWNLIVPVQLTGNNQAIITVIDANTFSLNGASSAGWVPYLSGGNARACATTFSGFYHLEGLQVVILADGNVIHGTTIVNGGFTLGFPAARVHVGLQYFADVGTQSLEAPQGSIQGKEARVPYATLRVINSRGWVQGQTDQDLLEAPTRQFENIGDPIALTTGDVIITMGSDWEKNGTVFIRQPNPLPLEIIDIIPAIELED